MEKGSPLSKLKYYQIFKMNVFCNQSWLHSPSTILPPMICSSPSVAMHSQDHVLDTRPWLLLTRSVLILLNYLKSLTHHP